MLKLSLLLAPGMITMALLSVVNDVLASSAAAAEERSPALISAESGFAGPYHGITQAQEGATSGNDDRVAVQVWTVLAAGGAAAVGLVLFLLRLALGLVKPPPPQQDESHH